jgi:hypothetical protein
MIIKNRLIFTKNEKIFLFSFFLIYFLYISTFIHQGFNATDEGWIIQLGNRIKEGQIPYKDFHYNRPPLSIYKQALYITLIDNYSIFQSRLIWSFEIFLCLLLTFFIIRKVYETKNYYIFLLPVMFFVNIYFYFPSYTFDAVLFALISIYFLLASNFENKKFIIISGIFSFFSFLSKQNFLILSISLFFLTFLNFVINKYRKLNLKPEPKILPYYIFGFCIVAFPYIIYLINTNTLYEFIYHVFILPNECLDLGNFFLFRGLIPFLYIPLIVMLTLTLVIDFKNKILNFLRFIFVILFIPAIYLITNKFTVFLNTIALFLFLILTIQFVLTISYKIKNKNNFSNQFITLIYYAFILQYMAGLAYSGLFISYPGFFLSLPITIIILYNNFFCKSKHFIFFKIFIPKKLAILFLISITFLAIFIHQNFVYRDYPREFLTFPFSNEKMRGIFSNENNVKKIDTLVNYIQKTQMKMIIFLFFRISQ